MVSYYNHMAMYRQQTAAVSPQTQFHNPSLTNPSSWYSPYTNNQSQHHQQFFNCMQEGQESQQMPWHHSVFHQHQDYLEHKYILPHSINSHQLQQYQQQMNQVPDPPEPQLPSPPMSSSELSSPGANGNVTPPQHARPGAVRSPYDWITKPSYQSQPNPGKTRTKDKYRVVYTDHQRLELEKEFHFSRYITIRRKAELAANLGLSERQVKIWFQNRRAKERKQVKKREELNQKDGICNTNNQFPSASAVTAVQQLHQQTLLHHQQHMNNLPLPLM